MSPDTTLTNVNVIPVDPLPVNPVPAPVGPFPEKPTYPIEGSLMPTPYGPTSSPPYPGGGTANFTINAPPNPATNPVTINGAGSVPTNPNPTFHFEVYDKDGKLVDSGDFNRLGGGRHSRVLDTLDPAKNPYTIEVRLPTGGGHAIQFNVTNPTPIPPSVDLE